MSRLIRICEPLSSPSRRAIQSLARVIAQVTSTPMTMPPSASHRNVPTAASGENNPVMVAATAKRMHTRPEASLSSDSPSRMCSSRLGIGAREDSAETATGSVGETTAASAKATGNGIAGIIQLIRKPRPTTVKITSPTASSRMVSLSRNKPSLGMRQPSRNSSGGRNSRKNTSGSSSTGVLATSAISAPSAICTMGSGTDQGRPRCSQPLTTTASSKNNVTVMLSTRPRLRTVDSIPYCAQGETRN